MTKQLLLVPALLLAAAVAACGGDDGGDNGDTPEPTMSLEQQLESILLTSVDVPAGLQPGGLAYSTNEQVASGSATELERLNQLGRQLGVDLTFLPTDELAPDVPVKGGIQNSASVYTNANGASETFKVRSEAARTNDWAANYTDLSEVRVRELERPIGDETTWLRISGLEECILEPSEPGGTIPPGAECPAPQLTVIDQVLARAGRTFIYLQAVSAFEAGAADDVFADQIQAWVQTVVDRANATFP